jgi:hypothetical protein
MAMPFLLKWCCATLGEEMHKIKIGTIIFATSDCKAGIADARAYLAEMKLKPDQVRLYRHDGQVLIQTLKPVALKKPN